MGFEVYGNRADILGTLREALPADAALVGFINHAAGPESPLWKPYGKRTVRHLTPGTDPERGMRHVVLNTKYFEESRRESPETWLARLNGTVLQRMEIRPLVKESPSEWWVVQLPPKTRR